MSELLEVSDDKDFEKRMSNDVEKEQKKYLTNRRVHGKLPKLLKTKSKQPRVESWRRLGGKRKLKNFKKTLDKQKMI